MSARTIAAVIALSVAMGGAVSHAQGAPGFEKGDRTLTLSGSGSSDKDFDSTIASIELGLGWFLADDLAFALRQGIGVADTDSGNDWHGSTRLGLDYYFLNPGTFQPFVGASIGYLYGDDVKDQFIAGPSAGLLWFVNSTTYVSLGMEYQFLFRSADEAKDRYDDGRFVYTLGMGVKW